MTQAVHVVRARTVSESTASKMLHAEPHWRDVDAAVVSFGFRCWTYSAAPTCSHNLSEALRVTTYESDYVDACVKHDLYPHFATLAYVSSHLQPASFQTVRKNTPLTKPFRAALELNRRFAVTRGIVLPLKNVLGYVGMLSMVFDGTDTQLDKLWGDRSHELLQLAGALNGNILARHGRSFVQGMTPRLSPRQMDILECLARGCTSAETADALHLSIHTFNKHVAVIKHRLGARTTAQTTALAVSWGLIPRVSS
jgi:DNA-binding CsgD family transcriptional regulator